MTPETEAKKIIEGLHEHLGLEDFSRHQAVFMTGEAAVEWMDEKKYPSVNQHEWIGFYLKHLVQDICKTQYPGEFEEVIQGTFYQVKGKYLWDTRFYDEDKDPYVPLNDVKILNKRLDKYGGFGLLLAEVGVEKDDGTFAKWRTAFKGGPSKYELKRRIEGVKPKPLKSAFAINYVFAYYFTKEQFLQGLEEGWVTNDTFQANWRNSDDDLRNSKYLLLLGGVPKECRLFIRNFNHDQDDFKFEYGNVDIGEF